MKGLAAGAEINPAPPVRVKGQSVGEGIRASL